MSRLTKYLNTLITGNIFDTPEIRELYATDRSILKITPKLVAFPESTDDLQKICKFFFQLSAKGTTVPVAIRGSGLDELGADLSTGVVISTEKLNHLQEIDTRDRLVRVQAGITLKELNTALSVSGLTIPICSNENDTIGSLISNCLTDPFSGKYGGIMNYVEQAEIILSNGECIHTGRLASHQIAKKTAEKTLEGKIYQTLSKINDANPDQLTQLKSKTTSAGYPTIAYAIRKDTIDLLPLFFSSEGTLGVISEVILRAAVIPPKPVRFIASFLSFKATENFLNFAASLSPREANIFDMRILKKAEKYGKKLAPITQKASSGFVVYLSFDEKNSRAMKKINKCVSFLKKTPSLIIENNKNSHLFDELENTITSFLNLNPETECPPLLTDFYLPQTELAKFLDELEKIETKTGLTLPFYGSYLTSNYHIRPEFNFSDAADRKKAILLLKNGSDLIHRHNGSIAGGSPEGRLKALVTKTEITETEQKIYREIKDAFDPNHIMNPGVKLDADSRFTLNHIRTAKTPKIVL